MAGVLLLAAGGLTYILFRPAETLLIRLAGWLGMAGEMGRWREAAAGLAPPEWVVCSLPAGLWALSYVLIIDSLTQGQPWKGRAVAISFVPLIGVGSELMQAFGLLPGTFDWLDLLFYLLPMLIINK